jgi:hypothetical protein
VLKSLKFAIKSINVLASEVVSRNKCKNTAEINGGGNYALFDIIVLAFNEKQSR